MKIYTKTGDHGETSLFTGQRVPKDNPFIEALGSVDECNSCIGTALPFLPAKEEMTEVRQQLEIVQHALFDVGAALATPRTRATASKLDKTRFDDEGTQLLEQWIDRMDECLPKLHDFILPGGDPAGAFLHLSRSICRRAERHILPLHRSGDVSDNLLIYLNRLSDYLFMLSRYVNFVNNSPEIRWRPHKT
jgi:cob(I)alamin adenosyltransferase